MDPACRPFCSERCRMADLGRWLSEDYRVPGGAPGDGPVDVPDANGARPHRDDDD
jgi:endogenous inhibitor of DNA gyrase (YacG/DUF329 family)